MATLSIGQLARQAGVNKETIRYYERCSLLPEPPRRASGYRQYSADYVTRIKFIKRAQALGFSLSEIAELLALRVELTSVCGEVQQRVEVKIEDIEAKIALLQQMKLALLQLVTACRANQPTDECPILSALNRPGED